MKQVKGYFSSNKKLVARFSRMFWMETIFCLIVLTFSAVSQFYQQKRADETYGRWMAAYCSLSEHDLSELRQNPLFETVGSQTIEGTLVQKKMQIIENEGSKEKIEVEQPFGSVGIADPEFFEMAGLKLKTGRLPQKENEICMEAAVLDGLGISYETGQPIELSIRKENPEDPEDFEEITKTYSLSGVLENYSSTWSSSGNLIRSFVSQPIPAKRVPNKKNIIAFIEPKKGYEDALNTKPTADRNVETNVNRLLSRDPFSPGNIPVTLCILLSFLFTTILQAESLFVWIWKRRQELRLLRIFGIHKKVLIQNVFAMLFKAGRIPYLILILALAVLIPLRYLPALILYIFLLQILVLIAAGILIRQIPLQKKTSKKKKRKIGNSSQRITVKMASHRFLAQRRWIYRLQIFCLILLQVGGLYFGNQIMVSAIDLHHPDIDYWLMGTPAVNSISGETNDPIPADLLNRLDQRTDIEVVHTLRSVHSLKMSWDKMAQSFLYHSEDGQSILNDLNIQGNEDGQPFIYPSIWMVHDPETVEQLKKAGIEGAVDWENWKNQKEAILYLPAFRIDSSKGGMVIISSPDGTIDSSIQPGDSVTLEKDDVRYEIPVSGILRNVDSRSLFFPGKPYDLILYGDEVDTVQISLKDIRNQIPVETGLSKLASQNELQFMNQASINKQRQQSLKTSIVLNVFSALILLSVLIMILQLARIAAKTETGQYLDFLRRIGLPEQNRKKIVSGAGKQLLAGMLIMEIAMTFFGIYFLIYKGSDANYLFKFGVYACLVAILVFVLAVYIFGSGPSKISKKFSSGHQ